MSDFYVMGLPEYFAFDDDEERDDGGGACCNIMLPDEDKQVLHYRSFIADFFKDERHMKWGGVELVPARARRRCWRVHRPKRALG